MHTKVFTACLTFAAICFITTECSAATTGKWRYKMTVVIDTPEGPKTGTTIRQIDQTEGGIDMSSAGAAPFESGDAVTVDLGKRGILFVLIPSYRSESIPYYTVFPSGRDDYSEDTVKYHSELAPGKKGALNVNEYPGYPNMVMFKDLNDPASITLVYETIVDASEMKPNGLDAVLKVSANNRLEEVFGKGVSIKEINLETTDAPVVSTIENILPWVNVEEKADQLYNITLFQDGYPRFITNSNLIRQVPQN